jgi:hypothetical protein
LELETSHFVRYHAASIAESIVSTFADRSGNFSAAAIDSAWLGPGETGEQGLLPGHDLDYPSTDVQLVGAFLFQSDAYLRLQASVESYVRAISALEQGSPSLFDLGNSLRLGLQLATARCGLNRPPAAKPGTTRLRFTCVSQAQI